MAQGGQYSKIITASTDTAGVQFLDSMTTMAIRARYVRIVNTGSSSPIYVNLTTTSGCTTGNGIAVIAGSSEALTVIATRGHYSGMSYVSSSDAAPTARVLALA